jgi:hypothetical protein
LLWLKIVSLARAALALKPFSLLASIHFGSSSIG